MRAATVLLVTLVCNLDAARADVPRCSQGQVDLVYSAHDLPDAQGDTGWFPGGSSAQLRLTAQLVGETTVAMSLSPTACWGDAMTITAPGIAQTGLLDSEYGAAFQVLGQIHTSLLGYAIDWEGAIPLPYWLPNNLLMAGTTSFDPAALPDSPVPIVSVTSNQTSPITLVSTDLLSAIIDLVGISGGLRLTAQGVITTSYHTSSIAIGDASLASATAAATIAAPADGFAGALSASIAASGVVSYSPAIVLSARLYVAILHINVVNWDLADVTIPLPAIDRAVQLAAKPIAIALPRLDPIPTSLGFAGGASQALTLHDAGEMALAIEVATAPPGVTAASITIPPGQDGVLHVTAADPSALDGSVLVLSTNDPSHATLSIALRASDNGETTMPAPGDHAGGCDAGGGGDASPLALASIAAVRRRRRR